jgi:hypothetical protein
LLKLGFAANTAIPQFKTVNAPISFGNSSAPQLESAQWSLFRLWQLENEEKDAFCSHHCAIANAGKTVFAQFTKAAEHSSML